MLTTSSRNSFGPYFPVDPDITPLHIGVIETKKSYPPKATLPRPPSTSSTLQLPKDPPFNLRQSDTPCALIPVVVAARRQSPKAWWDASNPAPPANHTMESIAQIGSKRLDRVVGTGPAERFRPSTNLIIPLAASGNLPASLLINSNARLPFQGSDFALSKLARDAFPGACLFYFTARLRVSRCLPCQPAHP